MKPRTKTYLALVPEGWHFNAPVATASTRDEARKLGAEWCNANLETSGLPVLKTEIPLAMVDASASSITLIPALVDRERE